MMYQTAEEAALVAMREADRFVAGPERPRLQFPCARDWRDGRAYCPVCKSIDITVLTTEWTDSTAAVTWGCSGVTCHARWKVELREAPGAMLDAKGARELSDWIESFYLEG